MTRVVIGVADQALAQQVRSSLLELEDVEVVAIAASSHELVDAVVSAHVDVALVHEDLGPEPAMSLLRDLSVRRPATALLLVAVDASSDVLTEAMESGARGLVTLPLSFGQLEGRMAAAAAWATRMRRVVGAAVTEDESTAGRGRVVLLAGAKGGVGTTTIATHLALDVVRTVPGLEVCLVDLDLEKGDVTGLLEVRHRLGISDLAKVADDLSPGTVADAVTRHANGLDLLLAPLDVRDVEAVTPRALRQVVAALRRQYDLVLVDAGSHVTPAQATALELADEVVLVVTPDVAALRGMRRTVNAWELLGVAKENDVRVLVNRTSTSVTVSMETVRQLTRASVLPVGLPSSFRRLEPALNARDPFELRHQRWWSDLRQVGREVGLVPQTREARSRIAAQSRPRADRGGPATTRRGLAGGSAPTAAEGVTTGAADPAGAADDVAGPPAGRGRGSGKGRRLRRGDRGSASVELIGAIPALALVAAIVWHMALVGGTYVLQSNAGAVAAREYQLTGSTSQAQDRAERSLPTAWRDGLSVAGGGGGLTITLDVPLGLDGVPGLPDEVSSSRSVVREPQS